MSLQFSAKVQSRNFEVNFELADGETLAVLGPNGAGKSTLLALLAGLLTPDVGAAVLDGRTLFDDGRSLPAHCRGVSLLAQEPLLFPHLSVLENVAFSPRSTGAGRRESRITALRWLEEVEATEFAQRKPAQLSGGQGQRVAVARALAAAPGLLLLDEPMAALDVAVAPALRRTLRRVLTGRSAIIVTHDVLDALMLADRVMVLEDGKVVELGPTREVLEHPRSEFAAGLAGLNLIIGTADATGLVTAHGERLSAATGDPLAAGTAAAAVFSPGAVSVFVDKPVEGSPRNVFPVTITDLESHGRVMSVRAGYLAADVTPASVAELELAPGMRVFFAVKSTEVQLYPL
ncbi:sulfate/molybdate ABC transporter ATP-binding protein [Arthrobacter roseus]|uniref:sulfate/molybdate ABC transporter ATP-binding protein n=1 Tax=Arthrobacter roseus TaxID=136274 RepID=UPI001965D823|nr:ATP-binding cassette domain-containing protein [Arthrobacter roseus]MBM7848874.1 molybdate transport system ATP-binding protein [Arthrobacter roseus]